jgi:hypothetical protein
VVHTIGDGYFAQHKGVYPHETANIEGKDVWIRPAAMMRVDPAHSTKTRFFAELRDHHRANRFVG